MAFLQHLNGNGATGIIRQTNDHLVRALWGTTANDLHFFSIQGVKTVVDFLQR
jgi:hypothetical protein